MTDRIALAARAPAGPAGRDPLRCPPARTHSPTHLGSGQRHPAVPHPRLLSREQNLRIDDEKSRRAGIEKRRQMIFILFITQSKERISCTIASMSRQYF